MAGKTAPEIHVFLLSNVCIEHHNRHVHVMFNVTQETTLCLFVNKRHMITGESQYKRDPILQPLMEIQLLPSKDTHCLVCLH